MKNPEQKTKGIRVNINKKSFFQPNNFAAKNERFWGCFLIYFRQKVWAKIFIALIFFIVLFLVANASFFIAQVSYLAEKLGQPELARTENNGTQTGRPNWLNIPELGIQAPIIYATSVNESAFQKALKNGVVHYPNTAAPGETGNVYIFGHSSDFVWSKGEYKSVFALLPKIKVGGTVEITDQSGKIYKYTVVKTLIALPKDTYLLNQETQGKNILTLQTSYPLGTALKRFIVRAEMK